MAKETDVGDSRMLEDGLLAEDPAVEITARRPVAARSFGPEPLPAVVIGELVALCDGTPMVLHGIRPGAAAVPAQTTVDLSGSHIGRRVTLAFEYGDPTRPIVIGVLRGDAGWPLAEAPGSVRVDVDGERLLVTAKEQLVLRCGKASITLTQAGKVLIDGTYVLSRSSGSNRIKGGSVQIN